MPKHRKAGQRHFQLAAAGWLASCGLVGAAVHAEPPNVAHASANAATKSPEPLHVELARVRGALRAVAPLTSLANAFVPFSEADADAALRRGGHTRAFVQPFVVEPAMFAWPVNGGRSLWVIAGRSGDRAVVAVLRPLEDGRVEHLASTVIEERDTTLVLTYSDAYPRQISFSTCYGCPGEGGTLRLADDGRVEITYR